MKSDISKSADKIMLFQVAIWHAKNERVLGGLHKTELRKQLMSFSADKSRIIILGQSDLNQLPMKLIFQM